MGRRLAFAALVLAVAGGGFWYLTRPLSSPGVYCGYAAPSHDGWSRSTRWIPVRDGTRLAADVFSPTRAGALTPEKKPVLLAYERYGRAYLREGKLLTRLDKSPWLARLLHAGYVVAVVDQRGTGASYGHRAGPFSRQEALDGHDVVEWLAAQPWSTGRVGMFGRSYLGITQYLVAATDPPHLVAIAPEMALFDLFDTLYPGGIFRDDWRAWSDSVHALDRDPTMAPVDEAVTSAQSEHAGNAEVFELFEPVRCRDAPHPERGERVFETRNPAALREAVRASGVAVYHIGGWFDAWSRDTLQWFEALDGAPQKLLMGPWHHTGRHGFDLGAELHRWFDHWLQGIDNGVMREPPVFVHVRGARPERRWRPLKAWPPPSTPNVWFLAPAGELARAVSPGAVRYRIDYRSTSGRATRWTNTYGGGFRYENMSTNDALGLSFTTPVLDADLEILGTPVVELRVQADVEDLDLFVYLEEVDDAQGFSRYVTEGVLRGSFRAGTGRCADRRPLPSESVDLRIPLIPTANVFDAGRRLRVTITGADRDNLQTPERSPAPELQVFTAGSRVLLPSPQ